MSSLSVQSDYYPITGLQHGLGPNGEVPMRMEIDRWWTSEDRIHEDQAMPITDKLSYFSIAGIHGEPRLPWDEGGNLERRGEEMITATTARTRFQPGIDLTSFFSRHQRIYEIMIDTVIPNFAKHGQTCLKHAAEQWRLPYWDWAVKKRTLDAGLDQQDYDVPQLTRLEAVRIRVPGGFEWVKNPLYVFQMPRNDPMSKGNVQKVPEEKDNPEIHFEACKGTSKYPPTNNLASKKVSDSFIEGHQNNDAVIRAIRDFRMGPMPVDPRQILGSSEAISGGNLTASLRDAFYRVITMDNYEDFSTTRRGDRPQPPAWGSLESIHNSVHLWRGGGGKDQLAYGHMYWPPVAAFDPIFWLHYCNVDRSFSLWQVLHSKVNPKNWFSSEERAKEALKPFRKNKKGDDWTSNDVYETATLGYTYADMPKRRIAQDGVTAVVLDRSLKDLQGELNRLYNSTRRAEQKAAVTRVRAEPLNIADALAVEPAAKIQTQINQLSVATDVPKTGDPLEVSDYVLSAKHERFALGGSPSTIHIFIGKPPDNSTPSDAIEYKNEIGQIFNFVAPIGAQDAEVGGCANCSKQAEAKIESTGRVVLTNALITRYEQQILHENAEDTDQLLKSMDPADVTPFLKTHLHWQVSRVDGQFIPLDSIPSLKIAVTVGTAVHYADLSTLSVYRDYKVMYDVTADRVAGARPEDHLFAP